MKRLLILSLLLLSLGACGGKMVPVKVSCPPRPSMEPVEVKDGTVSGKDLDNVIENHQRTWQYIHRLEKLGCTR